jgi:hypothetical protein
MTWLVPMTLARTRSSIGLDRRAAGGSRITVDSLIADEAVYVATFAWEQALAA